MLAIQDIVHLKIIEKIILKMALERFCAVKSEIFKHSVKIILKNKG